MDTSLDLIHAIGATLGGLGLLVLLIGLVLTGGEA